MKPELSYSAEHDQMVWTIKCVSRGVPRRPDAVAGDRPIRAVQRVRGDAVMDFMGEWEAVERAWYSKKPLMSEDDYWFVAEGMLRAMWIEDPAVPSGQSGQNG